MTSRQSGALGVALTRITHATDLTMDNIAIRWATEDDCKTAEVMAQPFDWEGRDPVIVASRFIEPDGSAHDFHLFIASDGEELASYEIQ